MNVKAAALIRIFILFQLTAVALLNMAFFIEDESYKIPPSHLVIITTLVGCILASFALKPGKIRGKENLAVNLKR